MVDQHEHKPPRRDFIYWCGCVGLVVSLVYAVAIGWSFAAAAIGLTLGIVLAFPTAYDLGRRRA